MSIRVVHGASEASFELSGLPIETVAEKLRDILNIPSQFISYLDGHVVSNNRVLNRENRVLEFVKPFGQKDGLPDFWSQSELFEFFGDKAMERMIEAGLDLESTDVLKKEDVILWNNWLQDPENGRSEILIQVDIENEEIRIHGEKYPIDRQMAAVVQCLINANGERRTTTDMAKEYPQYIFDKPLYLTISRKLEDHESGIYRFIERNTHGYRLIINKVKEPPNKIVR